VSLGVVVLQVDADSEFAGRTAAVLEEHDDRFEVRTEAEPSTALSRLGSESVDCLVSSDTLPGRDGLNFLRSVREEYPDLPVVFLAGEGDERVASRAISAGVTDYLRRERLTGQSGRERFAPLAESIERALDRHEHRRRFETLVENLPGMAYRAEDRTDWRVDLVSGEVARLTGYPRSAFESGEVGLDGALLAPVDRDDVLSEIETQLDTGDTFEVSYRIVTADGTRRWVRERGQTVSRPTNGSTLVEGFLTDITEQVEQKQELERYQQFLEHLPDTVAVLDDYLSVVYQSPSAPELEQKPVRVGEEGGLFEHIHPEDHDRVGRALERLLVDPDSVVTLECRARAASGEWRWVEARAQNYIDTDPVDGILVSVRDITQRRQREQEITRYSETLESLQKTTQQLLDATDREEVTRLTMESIETVLEFEVAGMWLADDARERLDPVAITGDDALLEGIPTYSADTESISWEAYAENSIELVEEMEQQERRYNPETPIRSEMVVPLGEYGLLNIGATEPGGFTETDRTLVELWAGTVTTVLGRLEREQQLREQEAATAHERDRLEAFASVVSHDLRNPLHVASSRLELLADEHDSEHLPSARRALDRMERLIDDLLVLARDGETVHDPDPVALGTVAEESWTTARTTGARLVVEADQTVLADEGRLRQVFENLFRNAVEHGITGTPGDTAHGSADGRTGSDDTIESEPRVTVTVGELLDGFYVEDDGPGVPESRRDQVFDSGYSTGGGGNGLGLSIVDQIVTAHGWEIRVTEGTEGGARFEITGVETH